jgi:hypothetical protein
MLVEEDGLQRLPIFYASAMEMIVLLLELGDEGRDKGWDFRVVAFSH